MNSRSTVPTSISIVSFRRWSLSSRAGVSSDLPQPFFIQLLICICAVKSGAQSGQWKCLTVSPFRVRNGFFSWINWQG
jgi:hypothetical protein